MLQSDMAIFISGHSPPKSAMDQHSGAALVIGGTGVLLETGSRVSHREQVPVVS